MVAILERLLRAQYRTRTAANGEQALEMALAEPPDLVLLDVMMPGMNGFEVCRELKARAETKDIPVIFLTALDDVEDEKTGFDAGAVDYITKPISQPILLARVKNHLALKAAADFLKDKNRYLVAEVARRTSRCRSSRTSRSWRWPRSPRRATTTPATTSAARSTTCARWRRS